MDQSFWRDKRVLITGFEGFLGSRLTQTLLATPARLVGLDIETFRRRTVLTAADYKKFTLYNGSVADFSLMLKILRKHKIDVVFHLAAEAIVGKSLENPRRVFTTNITGTWELLEACRQVDGVEAIVVASSDKAYGSHKKLPYAEGAPLVADHPYDVSKSCADLIAYTYFHTFDLPVAVTRCGNIYGPGDFNMSRLVPDALRCIFSGKTLNIRSDGKFVRDYVYVDDIVSGYLMLAEQLKRKNLAGEAFNFSDETPLTVLALLKKMSAVLGRKGEYKILNTARYEIKRQYLAAGKARRVLGWQPRYSLEAGLKATAAWYKGAGGR